jgi:KUP system potassium uptake protein
MKKPAPMSSSHDPNPGRSRVSTLTLAALGVVYGDIGTSPLYAVKEVFNLNHGIPFSTANVLGGVSAIFWSLMIVVSVKYVVLIMRADNKGEGGIMALVALAIASVRDHPKLGARLALVGVFGAALFYGDGVITPAISVLSAIEGLEVATPLFKPYIVPLTVAVVIGLFSFQRKGTSTVGALFGPVMIVWFLTLAAIGVINILKEPKIFSALNLIYAFRFLTDHGFASFVVLGSVFLAVTGAETLYADMGHFGKRSIRLAWFGCVLPGLTLNYFGQGALLIGNPRTVENPFYLMFPDWALYPMVVIATIATVIASQAVITGTYSMTKQAIQLGFLPRTKIVQTSEREIGQIYIPGVNWVLLIAIVTAVIGFGSSTRLASAYGVAVSGTMLITTFLTFFVLRYCWHYNLMICVLSTIFFFMVDAAFLSANMVKLLEGGWFPFALGIFIFTVMVTWRRGREILFENLKTSAIALQPFLETLFQHKPHRVHGTAVFLIAEPDAVPHALLHNLAHNQIMHERTIFMTVMIKDVPWVPTEERVIIEPLGNNCYRINAFFGFKDTPDVPQALEACNVHDLEFNMLETSFFLSRETVIPTTGAGMAMWRERLFAAMIRNAGSVVEYFRIPPNRVIELGTQVEI